MGAGSWAALLGLAAVNALSFTDRAAIGVLGAPIKRELALSDAQFGLLAGFAFSIVYALAALPVTRLADRLSRRGVLAALVALWSLAVALGAAARGLPMLALSRVGVGLGEAGGGPILAALAVEQVPPARRTLAIAVLTLGAPLGSVIGLRLVGGAGEAFGWRAALVGLGALGLAFAAIPLLLPKRVAAPREAPEGGGWRAWLREPAAPALALAYLLATVLTTTMLQWAPQLLQRGYGMGLGEVAQRFSLVLALAATLGTLGPPLWVEHWARGEAGAGLRAASLFVAPALAGLALAAVATQADLCLLGLFVYFASAAAVVPVVLAAVQAIAPERQRTAFTAALLLPGNLVGIGAGPLIVGLLSDHAPPWLGRTGLGQALFLTLAPCLLVALPLRAAAGRMPATREQFRSRRRKAGADAEAGRS